MPLPELHAISLGLDPASSIVVLSHSLVQEACKYFCLHMSTRETRNINTNLPLQSKRCITCFLSQKLKTEVGNTNDHCTILCSGHTGSLRLLIFIFNNLQYILPENLISIVYLEPAFPVNLQNPHCIFTRSFNVLSFIIHLRLSPGNIFSKLCCA